MRYVEPTPEQERFYREWLAERPEKIREVGERFDPWSLYRMRSTGHRVTVYSLYENDGRVELKVNVLGEFNLLLFERQVFGIDPDDLEPCDLPGPAEPVGEMLDEDGQLEYINARRAEIGLAPLAEEELTHVDRAS